jgi:hypothetical protein
MSMLYYSYFLVSTTVGLWIIAAWRDGVMATLPIATNRLSYCPSWCGYTLFCLFVHVGPPLHSVMYMKRNMRGAKDPYGSFARSLCCASVQQQPFPPFYLGHFKKFICIFQKFVYCH